MKIFLLFISLSCALQAAAQEVTKLSRELEAPFSKEVYEVLKSDHTIKNGWYGKYLNNGMLAEKGSYLNNNKAGAWEYYGNNGELEQRFNWTNLTLEFIKPFTVIEKYWVEENGRYLEKQPDERPVFLGGDPAFYRYLNAIVRYPALASRSRKSGVVQISAIITAEGKMVEEKVYQGAGYGLDEEAMRVLKAIPHQWVPGKINGKPVNTKILLPFTFKMI